MINFSNFVARKPGKLGVHEKGKGGSRGGGRDVGDSKSGGENEENGGSDNNPQDKQTQVRISYLAIF